MFKGTTIVAIRHKNSAAIAGDGQITLGQNTVFKNQANKIRKIYNGKVMVGFAGSVADSITLYEKFENKLDEYNGNLKRGAIELAKEWRSDKVLRKLEAMLIALDNNSLLVISGGGEVIEPDDNVAAIGSGGNYALSAAKALVSYSDLNSEKIAIESIKIASSICVYTNDNINCEKM